eukprot:COSAG01_NODE_26001_length_726_cov_1.385965_1_plen_143_part_00
MGGPRARWRLWLGADVAQSRVGFRGTGLQPASIFAYDGKSDAGVDVFDAAVVKCRGGATMAVSGVGAAVKHAGSVGSGTFIQVFGDSGTMTYDGSGVEVSLSDGARLSLGSSSPSEGSVVGQSGVWRFVGAAAVASSFWRLF